jgi:hypothetical protein
MKLLGLILLLLSACSMQAQVVPPALPKANVNIAMPTQGTKPCPTLTTGSNCVRATRPGNAADFQAAMNAATCGDTIVLTAGSTYRGNFRVPPSSAPCSGWVLIVSTGLRNLPAPGHRVGPPNFSQMATISTPNESWAWGMLNGSGRWRIIGVEITTSYVSTTRTVYNLIGSGVTAQGAPATLSSQLPIAMVLDRIYIHGLPKANVTRAVDMNAQQTAIVDSYCDEIHYNQNDSQCFGVWNAPGPFLIQNNFIQAAGENFLSGGVDPTIPGLVPSDITVVGNLFQKSLTWRHLPAPYNWMIKNLLELKSSQRVLIDGNVFQFTWAGAQDEALIIRSAQNGQCPQCIVSDVTVTHNRIQHVPMGVVMSPSTGPQLIYRAQPTARVLLQNNLLLDVDGTEWGGNGWAYQMASNTVLPVMHDIIIDHNTSFCNHVHGSFLTMGDSSVTKNVQLTNLLGDYGQYGIEGSGKAPGVVALETFTTNLTYKAVALINSTGVTENYPYPPGTFWSRLPDVGFTSYVGTDPDLEGNFKLLSTSPFHDAGTDGKDIGVWDWACLMSTTLVAGSGNYRASIGGCFRGSPQ